MEKKEVKVRQVGNSLTITIPKEFALDLALEKGDKLFIRKIENVLEVEKKPVKEKHFNDIVYGTLEKGREAFEKLVHL